MKLALDRKKISDCRKIAVKISKDVRKMINAHSTVATERSVLRLMGIEGAYHNPQIKQHYPLANVLVDQLQEDGALGHGASYWIANACLDRSLSPAEIAEGSFAWPICPSGGRRR
jgi:beta-lysine 5,6-aminomutase alpha subunit